MSTPGDAPITRGSVGLRSERGPILLSVMLSSGLIVTRVRAELDRVAGAPT